jgi:hypothetical protein
MASFFPRAGLAALGCAALLLSSCASSASSAPDAAQQETVPGEQTASTPETGSHGGDAHAASPRQSAARAPGAQAATEALRAVERVWMREVEALEQNAPSGSAALSGSAATRAATPTLMREPLSGRQTAMGLVVQPLDLLIISADSSPSAASPSHVLVTPVSITDGTITVTELALDPTRAQPAGFAITIRGDRRSEDILVLAGRNGEPVIVRDRITSQAKVVLRDLTGSAQLERVRYAVVLDAEGFRDVIVDASIWTGTSFEIAASLSVLRAVNGRLSQLADALRAPPSQAWTTAASRALLPSDGTQAVATLSEVLPAQNPVVPAIRELPVVLGDAVWNVPYEFGVDGAIFRLELIVEADPFAPQPVRIAGLD